MAKPVFQDQFTALQRQVINDLAEIEKSDRNACENCGGEDCQCCEIYQDRQKWISPEELFSEDDLFAEFHDDDDEEEDDDDYDD